MSILRYTASLDTTITNAYKEDLSTRGTGSNMGMSDSLEAFSIYGQTSSSVAGRSSELSRILIKFDATGSSGISADRASGTLPASGSVSFYLRMFNATHPYTLPENYHMIVSAVSGSDWQEGYGLDMESYKDSGVANWISASTGNAWINQGGDYWATVSGSFTASFKEGPEDLELDITQIVEQWVTNGLENYGLGIMMTPAQESDSRSYYTKKFFARGTEYFFKKPIIEARWNSAKKDDRENFYYSSSLAPSADNMNTLYLYNEIRGRLVDIPEIGKGEIYVDLYSGSLDNNSPTGSILSQSNPEMYTTYATGGWVETGVYSCSICTTSSTTPLTKLFDVWHNGTGSQYFTGSIYPRLLGKQGELSYNPTAQYVSSITNLRAIYSTAETARFRIFSRLKDWNPTIYTKVQATAKPTVPESGSYRVTRVVDGYEAISYGTGSDLHTQLSYDISGSYFDLDISMLEPGYSYEIHLSYYNGSIGSWVEQPHKFKFRVE